ncbi:MAG: hypothetical protein RJA99_502 [Pseudomonadota bacterium]|jgi:hypothetical protein
MSATPACPASRPLLALLSDALGALVDPPQVPPRPRLAMARPPAGGYAGFEAPTYQRRGIRITGLDVLEAPGTCDAAASAAVIAPRPPSRD